MSFFSRLLNPFGGGNHNPLSLDPRRHLPSGLNALRGGGQGYQGGGARMPFDRGGAPIDSIDPEGPYGWQPMPAESSGLGKYAQGVNPLPPNWREPAPDDVPGGYLQQLGGPLADPAQPMGGGWMRPGLADLLADRRRRYRWQEP